MMSKEAMKLALEALEGLEALLLSMGLTHLIVYGDAEKAIIAIHEALPEQPAQPQEPVAVVSGYYSGHCVILPINPSKIFNSSTPLYASALAQPQQEPVAKVCHDLDGHIGWNPKLTQLPDEGTPIYTSSPASKPWVGLTDEEISEAMEYWSSDERSAYGGASAAEGEYFDVMDSWRYIEAKLKEKNNG